MPPLLPSPHAHARIVSIDTSAAMKVPGVVRVFTGADLAGVCDPWVAVLAHLKGMKSAAAHIRCRWSARLAG